MQEIVVSGGIGGFGLEWLPQGERRDIVLHGKCKQGARQAIAFSGTSASLGLKSCRGAGPGILFRTGGRGMRGGMKLC